MTAGAGLVGPNALIQLGAALRNGPGAEAERRLFAASGLLNRLETPPERMVDEREPAALFGAVIDAYPPEEADELLREAGRRTADYVIANRIPRIARAVFSVCPPSVAARLMLSAIERNAWTFAGSGAVRTGARPRPWIEIEANPLATPGCPWHVGVFTRLFERLVSLGSAVAHTSCAARGDAVCRFEISL